MSMRRPLVCGMPSSRVCAAAPPAAKAMTTAMAAASGVHCARKVRCMLLACLPCKGIGEPGVGEQLMVREGFEKGQQVGAVVGRQGDLVDEVVLVGVGPPVAGIDRKSTRLNSSHSQISYAVFCLKKKTIFRLKSSVHSIILIA